MRALLALATAALLLAGCAGRDDAPSGGGDAADDSAPDATQAAAPYELGNASYQLGAPNLGPINTTVTLEVDVPPNATSLLVNVTLTAGASTGFRFSGLGECAHAYGNVAATGQTVSVPCDGVPAGRHVLAFAQDAGRIEFRVVVLALPEANGGTT